MLRPLLPQAASFLPPATPSRRKLVESSQEFPFGGFTLLCEILQPALSCLDKLRTHCGIVTFYHCRRQFTGVVWIDEQSSISSLLGKKGGVD